MIKPSERELKCIKYAERFYKKSIIGNFFYRKNYMVDGRGCFSQLWSDYGLRDYGSEYLNRGPFSKNEKVKCIEFWVATLYDNNTNITTWIAEIEEDLRNQAILFYQSNPGVHIQMQKAENLIIDKIDEALGFYKRA